MLHRAKEVFSKFFKRTRALIRYIFDYKIIFFSVLYISSTLLASKLLRNIDEDVAIGLVVCISSLILFVMLLLLLLRNILHKRNESVAITEHPLGYVHFFTLTTIVVLIITMSLLKSIKTFGEIRESSGIASSFTNQLVPFEGYIVDEPDTKQRFSDLKVQLLRDISASNQFLPKLHGYILVKTENYVNFSVGQVCQFEGILVEPENFSDFDYKTYLNNRNMFLIMENPIFQCADISKRRGGIGIKNFLIDFKQAIIKNIDKIMLEPQSSLLVGILFGSKRVFSYTFDENVRMAGVSHIVAASGYNITILVILINKILLFLPKKIRIILGLIVIWLFAILSGFSASIVRACIMSSLSLFSLFWGRANSIHTSLILASGVFVFFDPLIIYDVGFILSVSATVGLVYVSPILIDLRKGIFKKLKFLDEYVIPTMSCTLSTLPVSLITFKTFSIWSVLVNALVLPVIEGTMLWGVLFLLIQNIHPPLSYLFLSVANLQLKYFEYIVNIVGSLNMGAWDISDTGATLLAISLLIFLILFSIYFYPVENEEYNHYLKDN